jgi:hypothetical protein
VKGCYKKHVLKNIDEGGEALEPNFGEGGTFFKKSSVFSQSIFSSVFFEG